METFSKYIAGLRPQPFQKKFLLRVFFMNIAEFFIKANLQNICEWMILLIKILFYFYWRYPPCHKSK